MSVGVPRQLPVAPAAFVNRDAVRAAIGQECCRAHAGGRPAFVALYGAGGVGVKSAVWKWYWEDPGRFPDGALAVELGDAEHGDPAALSEALGSALVALGVPPGELPVPPLDTAFGVELFERVLGPGWCSVDDADPVAVVRACGGYPLAITTTAAQIAMTPEWDAGVAASVG